MIGLEQNRAPNPYAVRFLDGIAVKAAIRRAFTAANDMDTSGVKISVPANYVAVSGHVSCVAHRKRVLEIAERAANGAHVQDGLICR
jgi:osmotically-inducible protein OsmY